MIEKITAGAEAVAGDLKITIVTPSVTNRHTNPNPPYYVRGVGLCVIMNDSVGDGVGSVVGGGVYG
jgi:hypothetical protein